MTSTKTKLLEAKYFLECMQETHSERNVFGFNLSAFLAAARSITFIMQTEFNNVSGFKDWYAAKQDDMRNDQIMNLLNEKRKLTIHCEPVSARDEPYINITEHINIGETIRMFTTDMEGNVENMETVATDPSLVNKTEVRSGLLWYFIEFPEKDVITICSEHIVKLEALVVECESLFASQL